MEFKESPNGCYVILHIGTGPSQDQEQTEPTLIVNERERFQLCDDIWIEKLDEGTARNIQQACEPAHYKTNRDIWDRHLYAFVMRVPDLQPTRYEGLSTLHALVSLSRMVNPTSTGDRHCAHVMHFGVKDSAVLAIEYVGASRDITLGPNNRDWLSNEDGDTLRKLVPWAATAKMMHPVFIVLTGIMNMGCVPTTLTSNGCSCLTSSKIDTGASPKLRFENCRISIARDCR